MARVCVIGAGLGGMASAARLARLGHDVVVVERLEHLGGALGFLERDGYRWDTGPAWTTLPAVIRDLFRKSGRPLDQELELVPVQPLREHRFEDGQAVQLPWGNRSALRAALDEGLGAGRGDQWIGYLDRFAHQWELLRTGYLEHLYSPALVGKDLGRLLATRNTLHRAALRAFKDERLRALATSQATVDGHDPRNVPSWLGVSAYVEQKFGAWTVPGGMGTLATALTARLREREVEVQSGTTVMDVVVEEGRAVGVATAHGVLDADVVVCAVDPRRLPALAGHVRRTMPAIPPVVCHLGLRGEVPDLPHEVVLHGDPLLVVRTGGRAPEGGKAWTVLGRGRLAEDVVTALARRKVDVRDSLEVRVDRSPRELVEAWGGSPYGVLWQGRATLSQRMGTATPIEGLYCAGSHATPGAGVPFVGLGAALVAESVGKA